MSKEAFVYFMASPTNSTLYIGVTNNLLRRVAEHKSRNTPGFTSKYHCTKLVYFEATDHMISAIAREKQIKNWKRDWKNELIAKTNPDWRDLGPEIGIVDALVREIAEDRGSNPQRNDANKTPNMRHAGLDPASNQLITKIAGQARNDAEGEA